MARLGGFPRTSGKSEKVVDSLPTNVGEKKRRDSKREMAQLKSRVPVRASGRGYKRNG